MDKTELKRYQARKLELKSMEQQIEELKARTEHPAISRLSGMPGGGKRTDVSDLVCRLVDLTRAYYLRWDQLIDEQRRIEAAINQLEDPREAALLRWRYINGLSWEKICVEMSYSWKQIHRIHASALKNLKDDTQ